MSDQLDNTHAAIGLDLLRADPALTVYDGLVPNPTVAPLEPVDASGTYVLVYTVISWPTDAAGNALDHRSATCYVRWFCHCVAATAEGARVVAGRVRAALLNVRPTVTGRSCFPIRQEESLPPSRDESTSRPIFDAVAVYGLTTTP